LPVCRTPRIPPLSGTLTAHDPRTSSLLPPR
jgi:hypothetical protein